MYGTAEGSLGTLFRLPKLCFYLLSMLQSTMDRLANADLTLVKRSDTRSVRQTGLDASSAQSVLDGDLIEQFLSIGRAKQLDICKKMMNGQSKGDEKLVNLIVQLLQELVKLH